MTPLVRADRLAKRLGLKEVWVKNDAVSHPTLSFKDRVVSVAISKAIEFGFGTVACASTGNLANATAAQAAAGRAARRRPDPVRPRAGEGAGHQHLRRARGRREGDLRRRQPAVLRDRRQVRLGVRQRQPAPVLRRGLEELRATRSPSSSAGGCPRTSSCRWRADRWSPRSARRSASSRSWAWSARRRASRRIHGAQAAGCAPIVDMVLENRDQVKPVKTPTSIAKSLAIGNPADGFYARQTIIGSGGWAAKPDDDEIVVGDAPARRDRGHLHRDRGRRHAGRRDPA